jgi:hypothetical protein
MELEGFEPAASSVRLKKWSGKRRNGRLLRLGNHSITILFEAHLCPNCARSMKHGKATRNPILKGREKYVDKGWLHHSNRQRERIKYVACFVSLSGSKHALIYLIYNFLFSAHCMH